MSDLIDKAEAKAALQAWLDRHNYPVNPTLFHALDDLPARGVGVDVEEVARAIYDAMRFERKDKTPEWVKGGNSDAQVEARSTAARILAALAPTDAAQAREAALPRSANRVDYNPDGTLDEIVTDAGVHLEHMGGKRWFLGASRSDGTEIRVWFDGKVTLIEDDAKGGDA